jgi:hypothetical protein
MKIPIIAASALAILTSGQLFAELPQLTEKPWIGQFAVLKNKSYQITVAPSGDIVINPIIKNADTRPYVFIPINWGIVLSQ